MRNQQVAQEREPFQAREVRDLLRMEETMLDDKEQAHIRAHKSHEREREMTGNKDGNQDGPGKGVGGGRVRIG